MSPQSKPAIPKPLRTSVLIPGAELTPADAQLIIFALGALTGISSQKFQAEKKQQDMLMAAECLRVARKFGVML